MDRPSKTLAEKYIGPFDIKEIISPFACCLDLLPALRIHNVSNTSILHAAATDPLPGKQQPPAFARCPGTTQHERQSGDGY